MSAAAGHASSSCSSSAAAGLEVLTGEAAAAGWTAAVEGTGFFLPLPFLAAALSLASSSSASSIWTQLPSAHLYNTDGGGGASGGDGSGVCGASGAAGGEGCGGDCKAIRSAIRGAIRGKVRPQPGGAAGRLSLIHI